MNCFMFPGQPLSHSGTLPDDADFRHIAQTARERAGLNLNDFTWVDTPSAESVALQVYGVAMSLYRTRLLVRDEIRPRLIAEHSMGIYPALAASGALPEGDALELTARIGRCMSVMSETGNYALGCIVGLPGEVVLSIAENNDVFMANHNTSRHFLLSGERRNIEALEAEALARGAFSVKLFPCDAPLHTPMMEAIGDQLREIITDYRYGEPAVPLMNHIDQSFLTAADVPDFLLRELLLPVYWEKSYLALRKAGITKYHEVGVGDALKKYNRWIESEAARSL